MFDAANVEISEVGHHCGGQLTTLKPEDTPDTWATVFGYIDVAEVHGLCTELDQGRLISALGYGAGPEFDTANGYLATPPQQGANIYADDRARLTDIEDDTLLGGAAHVVNVNCNDDGTAFTSTGTTPKNIIDASSTTISAATPGFVFDGVGKDLSRSSGLVNLVMRAYGSSTDESYAT